MAGLRSAGPAVGIVANPASGRDIRRLVAQASVFPTAEKVNMVQRMLSALGAVGVARVLLNVDMAGISAGVLRALNSRRTGKDTPWPAVEFLDADELVNGAEDTTNATRRMIKAGVENNGYAEATSSTWSVAADNIADRAAGFGMPGVIVDGFDFFAVYEAAGEAIERARDGGGPTLIEVKFTRYYGHFEGDQQTNRSDEVAKARETLDCLKRFREQVTGSGQLAESALDGVDRDVLDLIEAAVDEAKQAPKPSAADLETDVYIAPHWEGGVGAGPCARRSLADLARRAHQCRRTGGAHHGRCRRRRDRAVARRQRRGPTQGGWARLRRGRVVERGSGRHQRDRHRAGGPQSDAGLLRRALRAHAPCVDLRLRAAARPALGCTARRGRPVRARLDGQPDDARGGRQAGGVSATQQPPDGSRAAAGGLRAGAVQGGRFRGDHRPTRVDRGGVAPVDRVALPQDCGSGRVWLPAFGDCVLEPVPGGWLIRVCDGAGHEGARAPKVVLDVSCPRKASLTVEGDAGSWTHTLSPRHAELLYVLASHPDGKSASELAADLFGDPGRTVTVRAEMSRLRRHFGGILAHRPYRFTDGVQVSVVRPEQPELVLPHSVAPGIRARQAAERSAGR